MENQSTDSFIDEAFVAEISQSQTPLHSYILKLVGNFHHTQDILQDTNIILWKKRMDWDPTTPFLKWAYRVAYFQTKGHFRDRKREITRLTFNDELLKLLADDEPHPSTEIQEALELCLEKIEPQKRGALLERYSNQSSVEQLAARYKQTPNSFSQTLRRLRSSISKCIQSHLQTNSSL